MNVTIYDVTNKDMSCFMFQSDNNLNFHNAFLIVIEILKGCLFTKTVSRSDLCHKSR